MTTRVKGITLPAYPYYTTDITGISVTPVTSDYTVQSAWKYGPALISPVVLTNTFLAVPTSFQLKAQNANAAFAAQGGNVIVNPGTGSVGNRSGNLALADNAGAGGAWNTSHYAMGLWELWFDTKSRLRAKNGVPANETDGIIIGSTFSGSTVYAPPAILAGASTTTTVGVAGAILGDIVTGTSFSLDQQGVMFSGYVSAANIVTVVLFNRTAGTVTLASGTLRVSVLSGT